jgi:hypothetical protein
MTKTTLVKSLLKPINTSIIIILGIYTIVWGLWIIAPWWTVFTTAPLYSAMAGIGSETFWGSTAIIAGTVVTFGAVKPSYRNLHMGAFVACLHWLIIGIFYFIGDWTNTGGITALTFAVYAAVVWVNIKINKTYYKAQECETI